jgi:hypothetical protein
MRDHTKRMKKLGAIIAVTLLAIFAIADIVHDFITNDPVHYFSEQPRQLLVVAAIAIGGGLVTFLFCSLSPHWQRRAILITLGSAAGLVTLAAGHFCYLLAGWPHQYDRMLPHHLLTLLCTITLGLIAFAGLLWFTFYQLLRRRDP